MLQFILSAITLILGASARIAFEVSTFWIRKLYWNVILPHNTKKIQLDLLEKSASYEEWKQHALELDRLIFFANSVRNDMWKTDPKSKYYDFELIQNRLDQFKKAKEMKDDRAIMFLLRTSLTRNIGDIGNEKLYCDSWVGTKDLIQDYVSTVSEALHSVSVKYSDEGNLQKTLSAFSDFKKSYGNTALLLSGGANIGLHHIGVIKCLREHNLLPRIISGSSSGSITASMICSHLDSDLDKFYEPENLNLNFLRDPNEIHSHGRSKRYIPIRLLRVVKRFIELGSVFDSEVLKKCMRENLGDITFLEAYKLTGRILSITVSSSTMYEMQRILNYLTAPNVVIWSAVVASCSVPTFFKSASLFAKDRNGQISPWIASDDISWIDGSVENDLPITKIAEMFNVNHFIVSQVNPHIVPFLQKTLRPSLFERIMRKCFFILRSELQYRLPQLIQLGVVPNACHKLLAILAQKYYGDITIIPDLNINDILTMFDDPSATSLRQSILRAEKATWPKLSIIEIHCMIENSLNEILFELRSRLSKAKKKSAPSVFLESQDKAEFSSPLSFPDQ